VNRHRRAIELPEDIVDIWIRIHVATAFERRQYNHEFSTLEIGLFPERILRIGSEAIVGVMRCATVIVF
jgi:hypothetical protein